MTKKRNHCWYPGCENYWTVHLLFKCRGYDNRGSSSIEGKFCDDHLPEAWKNDHKKFVENYIRRTC